MYRVRFYVNDKEIPPYIDYPTKERAEKAANRWEEGDKENKAKIENLNQDLKK